MNLSHVILQFFPVITIMSYFGPILHINTQKPHVQVQCGFRPYIPNLIGNGGHR